MPEFWIADRIPEYLAAQAAREQKAVESALRAETDEEVWAVVCSTFSRLFPKAWSGRVDAEAISHLGAEVMLVSSVN